MYELVVGMYELVVVATSVGAGVIISHFCINLFWIVCISSFVKRLLYNRISPKYCPVFLILVSPPLATAFVFVPNPKFVILKVPLDGKDL